MIDLFLYADDFVPHARAGSKVKLYFPSADEDDGMVMNSVRTVCQAFPTILSAFEKDVQENGLATVMLRRTVNNQLAEAKGKLDALGDTLLGLWNVVVDAGDIASTALPTSYLVDAIYEGVTGEERPSLLERNDLARGAVETATNAVNYVGDTVTGNKSWEQIKSDAKSVGQGLYDDYIDPFVKDAQYDQDNLLKGGLWTRSEEQSYAKGQNEFKKDMVVAEVAVSAFSAGTGTAAMRTVKLANKLDGPGGPKGLGGGRRKGIGGLLLGTVDDMMDGGASIFDGKMKTSAKTPGDKQAEIQAVVEKFQLKMKEQSNKEVDNRLDGGKGHTGSRAPEIQKEHAAKSLDIPNKNVLPKVVNGDSGHSNYSPSMNSKVNGGNKNSSQGSNKPDTEARTGHVQHAEKPRDIPDKKDLPKVVNGDFGNSNQSIPPKGKPDTTKKNDPQGDKKPDTEGTGNLKYKEGYYVEHLTGEVTKCTDWKGVSGGHNYEEFKKFFDTNGKYGYEEIGRKEHPDIPGIYDIEYRLKVEVKNYQGKGTGEYKVIPKEDKPPHKKTIYDPTVISNDDIVRLGKEAMEEGIKSQRVNQLKSQANKQIIRGVSSNGLKFEGIKNIDTGEIENFYPVLKFGEN